MAESPQLRLRVTAEMLAALADRAKKAGVTTSDAAREILAKGLRDKELASVPSRGRPTISENPKKL